MQKIIYNVTTAVSHQVNDEWLRWMQDIHIPEVLGTGCFFKHQLVKILETDESEGYTYAVQYYAASRAAYEEYINSYANEFRKAISQKWGEQVFSFRTLMEILA